MSSTAIGIDLAWSPRNPTGLAVATVSDSEVTVFATHTAKELDEILAFIRPHTSCPLTVAIDAPTIIPHEDRMRQCERLLHQDEAIRRAHAAPYPGTRRLLGKCNDGQPRGEQLMELLKGELGFEEVGCPPPRHQGRFAMEVFPAAAMVRLFDLTDPLVYKKKRGRTWDECRAGLNRYIDRLRALDNPAAHLPADLHMTTEKGRRFKSIEDRVDAVLCAHVAALAWLGRTECVGNLNDGYIVLPTRPSSAAVLG